MFLFMLSFIHFCGSMWSFEVEVKPYRCFIFCLFIYCRHGDSVIKGRRLGSH